MVNQHPFLLESLVQVDNNTFPFQQHLPFPTTPLKAICDFIPPLTRTCFSFFEKFIGQQMVHLLDSISKHLHHDAFSNMLSNGIFKAHRARILSCFNFRASVLFMTQPIFPTFQLSSQVFSTLFQTWLKLSHPLIVGLL
jgi:hypothetical protein